MISRKNSYNRSYKIIHVHGITVDWSARKLTKKNNTFSKKKIHSLNVKFSWNSILTASSCFTSKIKFKTLFTIVKSSKKLKMHPSYSHYLIKIDWKISTTQHGTKFFEIIWNIPPFVCIACLWILFWHYESIN